MSNYVNYTVTSTHGKYLQRALVTSEDGDRYLKQVRDTMVQMLEGDGTQDAHYSTIQARFGFDTVVTAHAAYLQIDTAYQKTSGDGNVSSVRSARDQLFSQLRL
jgi:hypothetical protein